MSFVAVAIGGTALIGAAASSRAADKAANAQTYAADQGVAESRYQQDRATEILRPYVETGYTSLNGMNTLTGQNGEEAYRAEIERIRTSPSFMAKLEQGETSILANASATGGLRGGNTQKALSEFSPTLLASEIDSQYSKLGGITQLGQASAAGEASAALSTGQQVAGLYQQRGAAAAGEAIAQGNVVAGLANTAGSIIGGGF